MRTHDVAEFRTLVEARLRELLDPDDPRPARRAAADALAAGGKRLRPLLVLAGSRPGFVATVDGLRIVAECGVAVELVHTASLVHDDIVDGAASRRGRPSIAFDHGRATAVAAGDLMFALAFRVLAEAGLGAGADTSAARRALATLASAARNLPLGEAMQSMQSGNLELEPSAYVERCRLKTGALFGAAVACGAQLSGSPGADVAALQVFGERIGVAFQLTDDLLDCTGTEAILGKAPGADLRDGTMTLPWLLAAREDRRIASLVSSAEPDVQRGLELIAATSAPATVREQALELVDGALSLLGALGPDTDVALLEACARRCTQRVA